MWLHSSQVPLCFDSFVGSGLNGAIGFQHDGVIKEGTEAGWIAVRSQAHDLVLVGIEIKAQMESHKRIEDADRVIRRDVVQLLQLIVFRVVNRGALCASPIPSITTTRQSSQPDVQNALAACAR